MWSSPPESTLPFPSLVNIPGHPWPLSIAINRRLLLLWLGRKPLMLNRQTNAGKQNGSKKAQSEMLFVPRLKKWQAISAGSARTATARHPIRPSTCSGAATGRSGAPNVYPTCSVLYQVPSCSQQPSNRWCCSYKIVTRGGDRSV